VHLSTLVCNHALYNKSIPIWRALKDINDFFNVSKPCFDLMFKLPCNTEGNIRSVGRARRRAIQSVSPARNTYIRRPGQTAVLNAGSSKIEERLAAMSIGEWAYIFFFHVINFFQRRMYMVYLDLVIICHIFT